MILAEPRLASVMSILWSRLKGKLRHRAVEVELE